MNNCFYLMHTNHWGFPYTMGFPLLYNNSKEEEALPHPYPASPRARELWLPWISKRWFKRVAPLRLATRGHSKDSPTPSTWVGTVVKCCFCPGVPVQPLSTLSWRWWGGVMCTLVIYVRTHWGTLIIYTHTGVLPYVIVLWPWNS